MVGERCFMGVVTLNITGAKRAPSCNLVDKRLRIEVSWCFQFQCINSFNLKREAAVLFQMATFIYHITVHHTRLVTHPCFLTLYESWNFNFDNASVTFDTAHLQSSYFHRPSMYSPKLCRTRSQWWGNRMMPLAAPVLLMVRTEWSTAEGLNPPCNCPIR